MTILKYSSRYLFPAILCALYLSLLSSTQHIAGKAFFLAHIGLFLIWQPFVRQSYQLKHRSLLFSGILLTTLMFWLPAWGVVLWIIVLLSLIGGRASLAGGTRARFLAFYALILMLLLLAIPSAFSVAKLPTPLSWLSHVGVLVAILLMLTLSGSNVASNVSNLVDFVHSLFVMFIMSVLVFGSLVLMLVNGSEYIFALLQSILIITTGLFVLAWAWNPRDGFTGIGNIFTRYVLSIGLPVDRWVELLTELSLQEEDPELFLEKSCVALVEGLPWVLGISWQTNRGKARYGEIAGHSTRFEYDELNLDLYAQYQLTTTLLFHFNVPMRLLLKFYADKKRETVLKQMSYMQAIHETGARLTHDIKNILQSLNALCAASNEPAAELSAEYQALLKRQLPAISNRLSEAITKLNAPANVNLKQLTLSKDWIASLSSNYSEDKRINITTSNLTGNLPADLFSNVVNNLVQNALVKETSSQPINVGIYLSTNELGAVLDVTDSGNKITDEVLQDLFVRPVKSSKGLGIGLFQSAQYANEFGYSLVLLENKSGRVTFRLMPFSKGEQVVSLTSGY